MTSSYQKPLSMIKQSIPGVTLSFFVLILIWLFQPNFFLMLAGSLTLILCFKVYGGLKRGFVPGFNKDLFFTAAESLLFISGIYLLNYLLSGYALLGLIILIFVIVAYKLWKSRKLYIETVDTCVNMLRGIKK